MTVSIAIAWWVVPTAVTLLSIAIAICWPDEGGWLSGLTNVLLLIPALFVSMVVWIIFAILK